LRAQPEDQLTATIHADETELNQRRDDRDSRSEGRPFTSTVSHWCRSATQWFTADRSGDVGPGSTSVGTRAGLVLRAGLLSGLC
jgi:hypothetical protein